MIWLNALHEHVKAGRACVLVTISAVEGSAPRAVGSRMLVSREAVADTIGGGALENQAIDYCRSLLQNASTDSLIESKAHVLGAELSQCCGGRVTLNYEYHPACLFNIVVFGAGHVAQCVAVVLQQLKCRALFVDSRSDWLSKLPNNDNANAHGSIDTTLLGDNPFLAVEQCPDNAYYLVMTHSHELDFDLIEAILSRGDSAYCGLIASKSKAARFRSKLERKDFTDSEIGKLTAPIGADENDGKLPMEVAIAAINEMLKVRSLKQQQSKAKFTAQSL